MKPETTAVPVNAKPDRPEFRFPQIPHTVRRHDWPFYLNRKQRAVLDRIRRLWGEDCIIQMYQGRVRIIDERGSREFHGIEGLFSAFACLNVTGLPHDATSENARFTRACIDG